MVPVASRMSEAEALLLRHFGFGSFRPLQRRVVASVLAGRDTLAVLPTGGGKSICFQIPALLLDGLTVVVSPLISLMQDQVEAAVARGLPAASLHSALPRRRQREIMEAIGAGALKLLYASPERLKRLAPELETLGIRAAMLAIDEAHCIAEWGHDFRPSYRGLRNARQLLGWPQTIALTGSATPEVRRDVARTLGLGDAGQGGAVRCRPFDLHLGSFDRANLRFAVRRVTDDQDRIRALHGLLRGEDRIAIVYAPTRNLTEALARVLRDSGYLAAPYHAGLGTEERTRVLDAFLEDRLEVVVATCAFGMGIDKPNVRLVAHWTMPLTPESYYQEAGRAGRDGKAADCVLLYRKGDATLPRRQLDVTFPPERMVEAVWKDPAKRRNVAGNVLASIDRLAGELRPERGRVNWRRVRERRKRAEGRIRAMEHYAEERGCRRANLIGYFGEKLRRCSGCDHCPGRFTTPDEGTATHSVEEAVRASLTVWRDRVAREGALPKDDIMTDRVLERIAAVRPPNRQTLARIEGVGPRLLAKFERPILSLLRAAGE